MPALQHYALPCPGRKQELQVNGSIQMCREMVCVETPYVAAVLPLKLCACRLLPALLRFAEADAPPECQSHALRFVEFCIHHLENDDPAIHHLAVSQITGCQSLPLSLPA